MTTAGPDVSARLAWPDDAAAIARIQHASWSASYEAAEVGEVDVTELADRWATLISRPPEARVRVLVAVERQAVRGFALVHPSADPDADQLKVGEIGEFVVDPEHQRLGHGSRLLQAAADTLTADSFGVMTWWVEASADACRAFATSAGWAPDGAHRELESPSGARLKQVRLHTALT